MYQSSTDPVPATNVSDVVDSNQTSAAQPLSEPARGFLTELTHAMQAAAEHQREATNVEVEVMTSTHLERVHARAAAEAEELRRMAQVDIDGIHAWQQAEADRIRLEAERRIVARGEELDSYLVRHAAIIDGEVEQIEGAVATYQMRLDEYFDQMTIETSPAVIAKLADEMPEPPDLAKVGGAARVQAVAALAAESDEETETAEGRAPVPVMASKDETSNGNGSNGNGHGTNGNGNGTAEHTNPALRLFRSIATLATPSESTAAAVATETPVDVAPEPVAEGAKD